MLGRSTIADIVFVHGLGGHPYKTWLFDGKVQEKVRNEDARPSKIWGVIGRKQGSWQTISTQKTVYWPADLLPDDIPDARIFTFGYDSHVTHWFGGPTSRSNIAEHGLTLLNAILSKRHNCPLRPLVFVTHSLGGILVKQALVESEKAARDDSECNLHKVCKGVLFFGTPHRGSSDAYWGALLANLAKTMQLDVNKAILHDLDPSNNSPTLDVLQEDFIGLMLREEIKVHTFQESAGKYGVNALSSQVNKGDSHSLIKR